ncbi:MAG: hypothetical protein AB7F74_05395 [Parvibaculaceae bacterium]
MKSSLNPNAKVTRSEDQRGRCSRLRRRITALPSRVTVQCEFAMKNITLSVDEDVLAKVRRYAAEHDTTVNALVRAELERIARQDDRVKRAMRELREMSDRSSAET